MRAAHEQAPSPARDRAIVEYTLKWSRELHRTRRVHENLHAIGARAKVLRILLQPGLDRFARGTGWSMLFAYRAQEAHRRALRCLVAAATTSDRTKRRRAAARARRALKKAIRWYRRGSRIAYQRQGWKRVHLQGLGEAILHLHRQAIDEAVNAISAGTQTGYVLPPADRVEPTGIAAIALHLYDHDPRTLAEIFKTYRYCRRGSRDLSAARKTLILAVLHAAIDAPDKLQKRLRQLQRLEKYTR